MKHIREHAHSEEYKATSQDIEEMDREFAWNTLLDGYRATPEVEAALQDIKRRIEAMEKMQ